MEASANQVRVAPDMLATLFAEQQRHWRRFVNAGRVCDLALTTPVGTTPHDVVLQRGAFKLLRYRRETPAAWAPPVLFCYALINRPYILDLQPDKSVVGRYLERGFDVYLIDWGVPSDDDRHLRLQDYVCGFLAECVRFLRDQHRSENVHLVGYCMGGTMSAMFSALEPEQVASLTMLAAPIAFDGRESLLNIWSDRRHFDVDAFIDTHGNCPAWFLQGCFLLIKPIQNVLEKSSALYELMGETHSLSGYFAMERWINDNIPMAGETFRQFVTELYQRDALVRGEFRFGDRRIDLGRVTCPVLLLTATADHLVPPSSTEGIRRALGSKDVQSMHVDAGHVGLVVGGKAQKTLWPAATRWLAERSRPAPESHA
jgi:polyhydroxyalkanoate synthase subunit PhaC